MFKYREQVKHISPRADQNKVRDASASRMNFLSINALILSNILIHDTYDIQKQKFPYYTVIIKFYYLYPQYFPRSHSDRPQKLIPKNTLKLHRVYKCKQS